MSRGIKAVVAFDEQVDQDSIRALLPGESGIDIVATVDDTANGADSVNRAAADLLVVACGGYSEDALKVIDSAVTEHPGRPVVVLSAGSPNGFLRRVFEAGADDIVVLPESSEKVLFALQKAVARKQGADTTVRGGLAPMVCVLGPKGGTGKTLTSVNLAVSLAGAGHRTVIVDLDLQFGDVGLALGLAPDRTVYDLIESGGSLDAEKVDDYLMEHPSGVRALLAPTRPDQAGMVTVDFLRDVWRLLRTSHDYVVVDTPPDFTPAVIAAVDASTDVCIVGMLDSLSLKNTKLGLETLGLMGYDESLVRVVLNRAGSRVGISEDDVANVLGRRPDVLVPSDRDIPRSINEGEPISLGKPRSEAATAFRELATAYGGDAVLHTNGNGVTDDGSRRLFRMRRKG